ncbi:sulfatase-like hydrolase/transferase [Maribellus comscasis]|uniref:Sulfatase-like hydrolase/transferase n=1 Tax=Maribellus comscasis TaxID=2681766 RepID=A0A6I6JII7_9BACT|nr:sulfatase [Maribellus comscasis]QGY42556.1 sulfatase-like hydrolase/transferase [Maribellus comscasis]
MRIRIAIIIFSVFALFSACNITNDDKAPLNILLFTADDLDKNSLGCYGGKVEDISPNIDKFAAEGLMFNHAYVNNSICAPSRGILATGLYGHNSGVMGFMKMSPECKTPLIMEVMREHGYQVGILSKVDHSTPKESFKWDFVYTQQQLGNGRNPDLYYKRAKDFFDMAKKSGKPFYFMVNSNDPHRPFFVTGQKLSGGMAEPSRICSPEEIDVPGFLPDLPDVRKELSYYYNSAKRLDDTFGKVMQALEESGYKENTLVIFISDNGIAVPFAKCDNYHSSSRTPWIVRWPGVIKQGTVNDENLISEIDYYPTILDALGIKINARLDGKSRLPLYKRERQKNDAIVFTQIDSKAGGRAAPMRSSASPMRGVQTLDYIYIFNAWAFTNVIYYNNNEGITMQAMERAAESDQKIRNRVDFFRRRPIEEFYDIKKDPDCLINLISDPEYSKEIQQKRDELEAWMKKYNDPLLYVYENRDNKEEISDKLYELYPDLRVGDITDK